MKRAELVRKIASAGGTLIRHGAKMNELISTF